MIMDYQSMVHESTSTLFKFRGNCRTAIENHVLAIELYQEDAYAESLSILAENKVTSTIYFIKHAFLSKNYRIVFYAKYQR